MVWAVPPIECTILQSVYESVAFVSDFLLHLWKISVKVMIQQMLKEDCGYCHSHIVIVRVAKFADNFPNQIRL